MSCPLTIPCPNRVGAERIPELIPGFKIRHLFLCRFWRRFVVVVYRLAMLPSGSLNLGNNVPKSCFKPFFHRAHTIILSGSVASHLTGYTFGMAGRRKSGKENIRSLSKVSGGRSYMITLPASVVRDFKWKERQKLELSINNRSKSITIRDWKK